MRSLVVIVVFAVVLLSSLAAHAAAPPAWDKKIAGPGRFKILKAFGDAAVLDKETGLVWEKVASFPGTWRNTLRFCALRNTGGRMGWRVPALEELLTIVDPTETSPAVPAGAPFENLLGVAFWTANDEEADATLAVTVNLDVFFLDSASKASAARKVLCVRGGRGSATSERGGI